MNISALVGYELSDPFCDTSMNLRADFVTIISERPNYVYEKCGPMSSYTSRAVSMTKRIAEVFLAALSGFLSFIGSVHLGENPCHVEFSTNLSNLSLYASNSRKSNGPIYWWSVPSKSFGLYSY